MKRTQPRFVRRNFARSLGVFGMLALGAVAVAGPSGVLAWGENERLLEARRADLARLTQEHGQLKNRVDLLDPRHADADLSGELVRSRLNVAHPDEMVMLLH
jgi:cell division protein FtsB